MESCLCNEEFKELLEFTLTSIGDAVGPVEKHEYPLHNLLWEPVNLIQNKINVLPWQECTKKALLAQRASIKMG